MNVAIVGYALDGRSSCNYFLARGDRVTICDQNIALASEIPKGVVAQLGPHYLDDLDRFDLVVRTSGMSGEIIREKYPNILDSSVTTNVNEFLRASPTKNMIGVTGTKGKGTTSTLIAKILEEADERVFLGGNIGVPPLSFISDVRPHDWVVLELSSFQLSDITHAPRIAVCLMVVPEHLNWHKNLDDYYAAKSNLFAHQKDKDIAIYYADNEASHRIASNSPGDKLTYYAAPGAYVQDGEIIIDNQVICKTSELKLLGEHNWQNVCAAVTAVWQAGVMDIDPIRTVLTSFSGLPHRLEPLGEHDDVTYFNDSFAATPDAAIAGMEAIPGNKVMIMGGFDRRLPIGHMAQKLLDHERDLRKVVLIGESAGRLAGECDKLGFHNYYVCLAKTMPEIVSVATEHAKAGDSVILSPGFASFDMFKNFEDRGLQFKAAVEDL
ncbi:MAG: UDP-N-acetylmuramoyl-L-alanine--D-glutamate ligase [Candidatus Saccharimonadales bacterium]